MNKSSKMIGRYEKGSSNQNENTVSNTNHYAMRRSLSE